MDEKMKLALERAESAPQLLRTAEEAASQANSAWAGAIGHEYARLLDVPHQHMAQTERREATARVILHVVGKQFPGLPRDAHEWARKAAEAGVALPDVPTWFAALVGPTAEEETWKHMLTLARETLPRVGEWSENRREAKRSKTRLTLELSVWRSGYPDWRPVVGAYVADRLRGLEAVVWRAHSTEIELTGTGGAVVGMFVAIVANQGQPGKSATGWCLAPHIRTFKNGRLDLWLRDEALARKVKAMLEGEVGNDPR